MDVFEIEKMAVLENEHWWYRGLRQLLEHTLQMERFAIRRGSRILDAGCGTGENLHFLRELLCPAYLGGFDISPKAVEITRKRTGPDSDIYISDVRDPELHVDQLDLVLSCDVISDSGIKESKAGLAQLVSRLRKDGLFIMNLPALRWLRAGHDMAVDTRDRCNADDLRNLMLDVGLTVELMTYRLFSLFPLVAIARLPSILVRPSRRMARSDLRKAAPWLNEALYRVICAENWAVSRGARWPWGSSIYAVGRKVG